LEQANKEIEEGEFGKTENLQAPLDATAKLPEDGGWRTEDGGQMADDEKNEKRTQSFDRLHSARAHGRGQDRFDGTCRYAGQLFNENNAGRPINIY
jgi:hypothetical protein